MIGYRTVYVALGIVAGYLAALLGLSFYARRRIGARLWRKLHRATVVVYVLGLVHALGAGTDAGSTWLRALMLATLVPAVGLFAPARRGAPARAAAGGPAAERRLCGSPPAPRGEPP